MRDKEKYFQKNCAFCNKPFFVLGTRAKQSKRGGTYCSHTCRHTHLFKRETCVSKNGYLIIPILINKKIVQRYEHREVVEAWIGRKLKPNEHVHHKDGNKRNNSITNLEVMLSGDHTRLHLKIYGEKKCRVRSCEKKAIKKKMCGMHYARDYRKRKHVGGEL